VKTEELLAQILKTKSVKSFLVRNEEHLRLPSLAEYLEALCKQKGIKPREVVRNADIDRIYGAKIFAGKRPNPSRDFVLRLAFGLGLDYGECQKLLEVAGKSKLYPRVPRDAVIISCLHNRLNYQQTEESLYDMGISLLGEKYAKNQE
jgi:transcriptional regulator with XRE-family HTH domain